MSAAEMRAIAEDARAKLIAGTTKFKPETVLRIEGSAARTERKLKLGAKREDAKKPKTLPARSNDANCSGSIYPRMATSAGFSCRFFGKMGRGLRGTLSAPAACWI
jgi:hypothetical protein